MQYNDIFVLLRDNDRLSVSEQTSLKTFLRDAAKALESDAAAEYDVYYGIAGLLATTFAKSLPDGHPLETIMTIAGELEANPSDADVLKAELLECIREYTR